MHENSYLPLGVIVRYKIQIIPEADKNLSEISVFSNLP